MADLDAAIRAALAQYQQGDSPEHLADAILGALVVCDRLDLSIGEHRQAARLVREAIARALGLSGGAR